MEAETVQPKGAERPAEMAGKSRLPWWLLLPLFVSGYCAALALVLASDPWADFELWGALSDCARWGWVAQLGALAVTAAVPGLRRHLRRVVALTLLLVVVSLLRMTYLPLGLRLLVSEPWLRPEAEHLLRNPETSSPERRLGLYRSEVGFTVEGVPHLAFESYCFRASGLAYAPQGLPAELRRWSLYRHVYGPWWTFGVMADWRGRPILPGR